MKNTKKKGFLDSEISEKKEIKSNFVIYIE